MNDEQYDIQERKEFWADIISEVLWLVFPIAYVGLMAFMIFSMILNSPTLQNIFLAWALVVAITFAFLYLLRIEIRLRYE